MPGGTVSEPGSRSSEAVGVPPRKRLTAAARKSVILKAARQEFIENGDMAATTIKAIAERGRISEAIIYRHFESKNQLFYEAVVEPLREAVDELVAAAEVVDLDEPLNPERQLQTMKGLYRQLMSTLEEVLPLLGLVLFGDPRVARRFYQDHFSVAMGRLAEAWRAVEDRYGYEFEAPDVAARSVMGIALMLALESHYGKGFNRTRALTSVSEGTVKGFFHLIERPR
jgi:AcrR family transcriptional regulator